MGRFACLAASPGQLGTCGLAQRPVGTARAGPGACEDPLGACVISGWACWTGGGYTDGGYAPPPGGFSNSSETAWSRAFAASFSAACLARASARRGLSASRLMVMRRGLRALRSLDDARFAAIALSRTARVT